MIKNKFNILPIILLVLTLSIVAFAGSPLPDYKPQFFDANGNPLTSGSLKLCNPGTTNVKTIYTNSGLTVPKSNPVNLDSSGRAEVWLNGTYDVYLYDGQNATGNLIYTLYNISSISEAATPFTPNYIDASEYGDLTATITTLGITTPYEVWVTDQQTLTNDTTIPATITLRVIGGGIIVADGYSLTFDGPLEANPAQQIFTGFVAGTSGVYFNYRSTVYPEWWGGFGDNSTDCTSAIAAAIASCTSAGVIFNGSIYKHQGITMADGCTLSGSNRRRPVLDETANSINSITITDINSPQIENLQLISTATTTGYAIYGASTGSEVQRYPKIRNVMINSHLGGIYLENPLDAHIDDCYIAGTGKAVSGGIGIDLVSGTTTTVSNTYVTAFEHDIEVSTQGYVFDRIICETADKGVVSTVRGTMIQPYFSAIDTYDIDLATNGTLIVGYTGSDSWPAKINFASDTIKRRTTYLPSTGDIPTQIFGRRIFYGTAIPTTGTWAVGDLYFNTGENTPVGWICIVAGTPGTWKELDYGYQFDKSTYLKASSSTDETDLHSISIPAGTLGATPAYQGGGIRLTAFGRKTGANGNKTIKLYFGSTAITVFPAANNENDWKLEAIILNDNSASAQVIHWTFTDSGTVTSDYTIATENTAANVTLKITGQCADALDVINEEAWIVERL